MDDGLPLVIRFLYTYPHPVTPKTGSAPWSIFNRYGWSIFAQLTITESAPTLIWSILRPHWVKRNRKRKMPMRMCLLRRRRWPSQQERIYSSQNKPLTWIPAWENHYAIHFILQIVLYHQTEQLIVKWFYNWVVLSFAKSIMCFNINCCFHAFIRGSS